MEGSSEEQAQIAEYIAEEDAAPGHAEQATASDDPSAELEHGAVGSAPATVDADAKEAVPADLEAAASATEAADDAGGAKDDGEPPAEGVEPAPEGEAAAEGAPAEAEAAGEAAEGLEGVAPPEGDAAVEGVLAADGELAADSEAAADGGESGEALPAEAAPPPPPEPPYVPPEVGEDYIPVAQLPPLPEPYGTNEEGKKVPLEGVQSIFLTGTTVEIVGLAHVGEGEGKDGSTSAYVSKEAILGDIQFRGAISDFYAIKQQILDADVDPLLMRINEDDVYGDGNNWQIVLSAEAGKAWEFIESETARRRQLAVDERLREQIERMKPRSQKARKATPWVSRGSEVEIQDMQVMARREPVAVILQRPRRAFNAPASLSDKDAAELWNSSQMECRPFKDPNFDLRRMEKDVSVQAVPPMADAGAQAGCTSWRPRATQCEPRQLDATAKAELCNSRKMRKFLERIAGEFELALIENEITNVFEDDFAALADEDAVSGNRKEAIISELQSFTHLTYSKNMVVSAIEWLPHRKGVVAVACTEAMGHQERVTRMGRPSNAYILIWNFRDPIHPEFVLQAPNEVFAFQFNPANPDVIAAGCYNGQVVLWDLSGEHERIAAVRASTASSADHGGIGGGGESGDGDAHIAIVKWRYASAVEFSHHHVVTDLAWLPGVDATRGKFVPLPDGAKECHFLATTAGDGKVNFWDIRMDKLIKKGRNKGGDDDLVWKPCHSLHIVSLLGMDLSGSCFCFNAKQLERGAFCIGSFDGEIVNGNYLRPDSSGENESTDCTRSIVQAHVGPVVALQRSPFYDDVMLSVGDWSFQVWGVWGAGV